MDCRRPRCSCGVKACLHLVSLSPPRSPHHTDAWYTVPVARGWQGSPSKQAILSIEAIHPPKRIWSNKEGVFVLSAAIRGVSTSNVMDGKGPKRRRSLSLQGASGGRLKTIIDDEDDEAREDEENPEFSSMGSSSGRYPNLAPRPEERSGTSRASSPGNVTYHIVPPIPRRFGIFCTAKSSMHGPSPRTFQQQRSRPVAVSLVED